MPAMGEAACASAGAGTSTPVTAITKQISTNDRVMSLWIDGITACRQEDMRKGPSRRRRYPRCW
jgi:hypothetical protein